MSEAEKTPVEKRVEEIVKRLKVRRISESGMRSGHIKKHLLEANSDISFLLSYTAALARELISARAVPVISGEPILLETDIGKLTEAQGLADDGAKVDEGDTMTPAEEQIAS